MKKALIAGVLLLAAGGALYAWMRARKNAAPVWREMKVERGDLDINILSTGTVQPENRVDIKPPIAGRVEDVLVKEGQILKKGRLVAWMSSTERAALIDAARAQGPAEVKRWQELYKPTAVLAPISGTVILRNVEAGQTLSSNDSILVMSDRLTVKAQVDETDIAQIKLKQEAEIILDAYPDQTIAAHVDQIAFDAKTVNNVTTYIVDVLPDKTPDFMRSGMTANVSFAVDSKENVVLVPSEAVRIQDGKSIVLMKSATEQPAEREVHTGASDGKMSEVLSGLEEGEVVVVAKAKNKEKAGANPFSPMGQGRKGGPGRGGH